MGDGPSPDGVRGLLLYPASLETETPGERTARQGFAGSAASRKAKPPEPMLNVTTRALDGATARDAGRYGRLSSPSQPSL